MTEIISQQELTDGMKRVLKEHFKKDDTRDIYYISVVDLFKPFTI
jgi:hypothetical protein